MHIRIFKHYIPTPYLVLSFLEGIVLYCSYLVAVALLDNYFGLSYVRDGESTKAALQTLILLISNASMGVYTSRFKEGQLGMLLRTLVAYCLVGAVGVQLVGLIEPSLNISRTALLLSVMLSVSLITGLRFVFFRLVDNASLARRTLIFGAGKNAALLLEQLRERHSSRYIVGCVPMGSEEVLVPQELIVKKNTDWLTLVRQYKVSEIVEALDERRADKGVQFPVDELLDCKLSGVNISTPIAFLERECGFIELEYINPGWMLYADGFRTDSLRDTVKRFFDVVVCLLLLLLTWPFMLLTAIAVVLESGWPVIYSQQRVGKDGKLFNVHKFRSMVKNAEKDGRAVWAKANDSRVTRIGKIIRNTRLDELPQIYNVLRGDMSFVGPRPERPEFVAQLSRDIKFYGERHRIKPGLMGWAQLNYSYGASVKDAENKLRYDLYYVKNHSVMLDLIIVVQTVEIILLGKGVH